jgi:DNA-binding PadR family transcriptional regulator
MQPAFPSEFILLGLLAERPMHGYELAQLVSTDEALRAIWHIEPSQAYFLLRKLTERGLIVETAEEQAGGPPRVIYAPTSGGLAALHAWLREPEGSPRGLRNAFLAKLYLALRIDRPAADELLSAQKQALSQWAARHRELAGTDDFAALVHRLRLAQVEAALATLEDVRPEALSPMVERAG